MSTELTTRPANGGQIQTHGFGETEVKAYAETSATALAARERAMVEARIVAALNRPRNVERFRTRLLAECERPGFAEEAEYSRPIGKEFNHKTEKWEDKYAFGPSIRLIESAAQFFGNLLIKSQVIFETDEVRIVECFVWDLETNVTWDKQVPIPKRVEKRAQKDKGQWVPPKGRHVIGQRTNSEGHITYLVLATDDETRTVQSALESKTQRKNAERLLPKDIIDEALTVCRQTMAKADQTDPRAAMRRIIDGFYELGVDPADLEVWVGKTLDKVQPKDIQELRIFYRGLKDGEFTFEEALAVKKSPAEGSAEGATEVANKKKADLFSNGKTEPSAGEIAKPAAKYVTAEQIEKLRAAAKADGLSDADLLANLKQRLGVEAIELIPVGKFDAIMQALQPPSEEEMRRTTEAADKQTTSAPKGGRPKL